MLCSFFLHEEAKKRWSRSRCAALSSILLLHVGHAVLLSLPAYLTFRFVGALDRFRSVHSDEMQLCFIAIFMMIVLPFLAFTALFEGKFNRWNLVKKPVEEIGRITVPQTNQRPIGVCPIQPDVNFTVRNKGEIALKHKKFKEKRDGRENVY